MKKLITVKFILRSISVAMHAFLVAVSIFLHQYAAAIAWGYIGVLWIVIYRQTDSLSETQMSHLETCRDYLKFLKKLNEAVAEDEKYEQVLDL